MSKTLQVGLAGLRVSGYHAPLHNAARHHKTSVLVMSLPAIDGDLIIDGRRIELDGPRRDALDGLVLASWPPSGLDHVGGGVQRNPAELAMHALEQQQHLLLVPPLLTSKTLAKCRDLALAQRRVAMVGYPYEPLLAEIAGLLQDVGELKQVSVTWPWLRGPGGAPLRHELMSSLMAVMSLVGGHGVCAGVDVRSDDLTATFTFGHVAVALTVVTSAIPASPQLQFVGMGGEATSVLELGDERDSRREPAGSPVAGPNWPTPRAATVARWLGDIDTAAERNDLELAVRASELARQITDLAQLGW